MIDRNGVKATQTKVQAIVDVQSPENKTELCRVLDMINHLEHYVRNISSVLKPFNDLL